MRIDRPRGFLHPRQRDMHQDYSRHGGRARALKLTQEERTEIAKKGGTARAEKARARKEMGDG